jgi:hypothetical protein
VSNEDSRELSALMIIVSIFVAIVIVISVVTLSFNRWALPFAEQTRRDTYEQSESYNAGTQADFDQLCLELAKAPAEQKGLWASTITHRAQRVSADVQKRFTSDVKDCIAVSKQLVEGAK